MDSIYQSILPLARADLACYCRLVHPKYELAPHHRLLIEELEGVERGLNSRFMCFMPPRNGKSLTSSILFPSWYLGKHPERNIILASYSQEFAEDFGRAVRNILQNELPQAIFPECRLSSDSAAVGRFHTTHGGAFFAVGRGGSITGRGGDLVILDDTVKDAEEAASDTIRKTMKHWFAETVYTRLSPAGVIVLVQTRWHQDDLAGWLLNEHAHQDWKVLSLPAIAEERDPFRKPGEALWPTRYSLEELNSYKRQLGSASFTSLYQQRPSAAEGQIFKREWWRFYTTTPEFTKKIVSLDPAFKIGQQNDYSVLQVWGEAKTGYYLLANFKARVEFPELIAKIKQFHGEWRTNDVLIEDASSGQSAIQTLKRETALPIRAIKVDKDKVARANAVVPLVESERVFLPQGAAWLDDYLDELSSFPQGAHDDQVDATTQALSYLRDKSGQYDGVIGYYRREAIRQGYGYDPSLFGSPAQYEEIRAQLASEQQADESEKLSPEDAKLHAEQAHRRRIQIEQHQQSLQRPEERIKLRDGSTVRWNRFLNCWQDVMNPAKTYRNCPGPTHVEVEGRR